MMDKYISQNSLRKLKKSFSQLLLVGTKLENKCNIFTGKTSSNHLNLQYRNLFAVQCSNL